MQHADIVLVETHHAFVADHVHIGLHGTEQRLLLDTGQILPAGLHRVFGLACRIDRAAAGKDVLVERHRPRCRTAIIGRGRAADHCRVGVDRTIGTLRLQRRAPARQGLRYLLVSRAQLGTLGLQGRIGQIGGCQRVSQGVGTGRARDREDAGQCGGAKRHGHHALQGRLQGSFHCLTSPQRGGFVPQRIRE